MTNLNSIQSLFGDIVPRKRVRIPYNAVAVLEESDPLAPLKGTSPFWEGGEGDDT